MNIFSYTTSRHQEKLATFGLVVLQSDETIEHDFQRLIPAGQVRQYVTRVPSGLEVRCDSLIEMLQTLPAAAALFPRSARFDVVGYGCTSATSVIGALQVAKLVRSGCNTQLVTEPLSALIAACRKLHLNRIALLSPYVEEVSITLRGALEDAGIHTPIFGSFDEAEETKVARIDRTSIINAAIELGRSRSVDAVFLSCTNLKTLDVIADIEASISKPVLSSNTALAWHMCSLAGIELHHNQMGILLAGAGE